MDNTIFNVNAEVDVSILWTGGWDSTYRMVELSRKSCTVQPIYVYGDKRPSEKYERIAMQKILLELNNHKETKATILPIKFIDKQSIPLNNEITKAYHLISKETKLGSQHEWLARLAFLYPGLELGTESAPLGISNILTAINKYGKLIKDEKGDGYVLDPNKSVKEGMLVLGNFKFPIIQKTGADMKTNISLWGYEDVMKNVWVCHTPVFGEPCGVCHPCELKIETDMAFLLTKTALKRYAKRNKQPYKFIYKIIRRISRVSERIIPYNFLKS
ncbi:hypothetical protein BTR22_04340 [Alkalihalophilus pseudofirmus]|uniref:hypothetical protein n=1 Tax=Alkalihalophilus pseudofirmus TaxID=79885 RepID=UPI000950B91F|nr:hypothetical protein BTR22_04340 [Alkalihalophilus pseudofirmus]